MTRHLDLFRIRCSSLWVQSCNGSVLPTGKFHPVGLKCIFEVQHILGNGEQYKVDQWVQVKSLWGCGFLNQLRKTQV